MGRFEILVTNDDGIESKGLHVLCEILRNFGNITMIAPAYPQSGMSAAVSLGQELFYKEVRREEGFIAGKLTGTPATCIKFGLTQFFQGNSIGNKPRLECLGISHIFRHARSGSRRRAAWNNISRSVH